MLSRGSSRQNSFSRRKSTTSVRDDIEKIYNLQDYRKACQLIELPPGSRRSSLAYSATNDSEEEEDSFFDCDCLRRLKGKTWYRPVTRSLFFFFHFAMVFTALALGARFLGDIEDPPPPPLSSTAATPSNQTTPNATKEIKDAFWLKLKEEFGIGIDTTEERTRFMELILKRAEERTLEIEQLEKEKQRKDRSFIFWKWLYFLSVACTTIGYGDIYPTTNNGRFFYMIFSLVGIPLVVSVLTACGSIIKAVNKRFFRVLNKCCFDEKPVISESLMATISIFIMFIGFIAIGCVLDAALVSRPLFESIYFWVVTFTTVGLGDITHPLSINVNWAIPLLVYRIFGLAMLAGVIDSLIEYIEMRKTTVKRKLTMRSSKPLPSFTNEESNQASLDKPKRPPPPRPLMHHDDRFVAPYHHSNGTEIILDNDAIFGTLSRDAVTTNWRGSNDVKIAHKKHHFNNGDASEGGLRDRIS